jgi:cupin superfamily acireductone dioxygenase involved in methionine salvage
MVSENPCMDIPMLETVSVGSWMIHLQNKYDVKFILIGSNKYNVVFNDTQHITIDCFNCDWIDLERRIAFWHNTCLNREFAKTIKSRDQIMKLAKKLLLSSEYGSIVNK